MITKRPTLHHTVASMSPGLVAEAVRPEGLAARQRVVYQCPVGHVFGVTLAADVEAPAAWDCPRHGTGGHRDGLDAGVARSQAGPGKRRPPGPSARGTTGDERVSGVRPYDYLLQRRTVAELDELLADTLARRRAGRLVPVTAWLEERQHVQPSRQRHNRSVPMAAEEKEAAGV